MKTSGHLSKTCRSICSITMAPGCKFAVGKCSSCTLYLTCTLDIEMGFTYEQSHNNEEVPELNNICYPVQ